MKDRVLRSTAIRLAVLAGLMSWWVVMLSPAGSAAGRPTDRGPAPASDGTVYFVDCAHGNDSSEGTSPRRAWRTLAKVSSTTFDPGDQILFRRGTRCDGVLAPHGSGSSTAPIVVAAYGSGPRPQLAGDGARATVYLHDVDEWELRDLDVSDHGPAPQPGEKRNGIWVVRDGLGTGHHYVVENVLVHDVNSSPTPPTGDTSEGDLENYSKDSGGIIFDASGSGGFDDVVLADDSLSRVNREGIYVKGGPPTTGLLIRSNRLHDIGGDGIVAESSAGAMIERNVVDGFDESGTSFNAGIWGYASTGDTFQFNDVSHGRHGPLDSMAYDIDGSNYRLTFQYNLSHDNSGGFLMLCNDVAPFSAGAGNGGSVVRYNISQNDYAIGRAVIDAPFLCGWENDISIYNNTVYTRDPRVSAMLENTNGSTMQLANNILIGPGPEASIYDKTGTWSHNLYLDLTCSARPIDPDPMIADPRFVAPGSATSPQTSGGYRLRVGSPALGAGVPIANDGGRDFYGNPIPDPPNIGAYQGPGVKAPAPLIDLSAAPLAPLC